MIINLNSKCIAALYLLMVPSVDPQVAMFPMFPPPMPLPMPMPIQMPMPMVPVIINTQFRPNGNGQKKKTTTTTTSTTTTDKPERNNGGNGDVMQNSFPMSMPVAMHMPMPMPVQIFPPPPPIMNMAIPPMMQHPPIYNIGYPPSHRRPKRPKSKSKCRSSRYSSEYNDRDRSTYQRSRKKSGHRKRSSRKMMFQSVEMQDNELIKPVLTYVSEDGDVKLKRSLSTDEAKELINDQPYQMIRVLAGEDDNKAQRVLVSTKNVSEDYRPRRQLVKGSEQHRLEKGKKELVFRPPAGQKISNLSVSFQISD